VDPMFAQDIAEEQSRSALPPLPLDISRIRVKGLESVEDDTSETWSTKEDEIAKVLEEDARFDVIGVSKFIKEDDEEERRIIASMSSSRASLSKGKKGKKGKKGRKK